MIEGIEILNKTEIMTNPGWYDTLLIIVILVGCICFGMLITSIDWTSPVGFIIFTVGLIVSAFAIVSLCLVSDNVKEPTGRYKYECLISDDVSFSEVLEHYDVVEQNGKIWVLKDKE